MLWHKLKENLKKRKEKTMKVILTENKTNPLLSNLEKEKLPHRRGSIKLRRFKGMVCQ